MRIVVPTTVKVVEASCNRKLQEVFYLCVVINVLKSVKSDGAAFLME